MTTSTDTSTSPRGAGGRVWLITGASSGFGQAIAEAALAVGDTIVATARRSAALDNLVAAHPERARGLTLDVTDTDRVSEVISEILREFGRIDVLVNNAGHTQVGAAEETTDRELQDLMDVHFFGPAALTRAVLPQMRRQGSGAIVQMSSIGGQLSYAGFSAYSATKCALEGYSEALAAEVSPLGITVLIVEPGSFRTNLFGSGMHESAPMPVYEETVGPTRAMMKSTGGKQPGDPARAAAAILAALEAETPPLRLALGDDAVDAITAHLDSVRRDLETWEPVSRQTAFDN
jgi:NAD(P)-dependent dehydrogenase (short-subunit alcohol dehydrogenase family)